jgi:hypothetical protein
MMWLVQTALAVDMLHRDPVGVGVGLVLGLPTGFSGAWHREGSPIFFDGAIAWSVDRGNSAFLTQASVLFTLSELTTADWSDILFPIYLGVGPRLSIGSAISNQSRSAYLGVRVPVGMAIYHRNLPLEGFLELAPGIHVIPDTLFFFDIGIGARFYFGPGEVRHGGRLGEEESAD